MTTDPIDKMRAGLLAGVAAEPRRRRRRRLVTSLTVVAVVVAGGGLFLAAMPEDSADEAVVADRTEDLGAQPDTEAPGTSEPTDTTATTTPTSPPTAGPAPDRAVVARVAADGLAEELVLVDLADGSVIRTFAEADNSDCGEIAACHVSYTTTAVGADGSLLLETCCEPAGGNVLRFPDFGQTAGSASKQEAELFSFGYEPAVDPSGTLVATAGQIEVIIRPIEGGDATVSIPLLEADAAMGNTLPTGLAWSPDGGMLAVSLEDSEIGRTRIVVFPTDGSVPVPEGRVLLDEPGRHTVEAWTGNGRVWVIDPDDGGTARQVRAVDVRSGVETTFDAEAIQLVADRSGTHLYVVAPDGLWRADPDATGPEGLLSSSHWSPRGSGQLRAVSVFHTDDVGA